MEREITDPVGYRYVLKVDASYLHIRRDTRQGRLKLARNQAEGLKAYLDKALRTKPSSIAESYDNLTLSHDMSTSAIQAVQNGETMDMYPPSWEALASEIALLLPHIGAAVATAAPAQSSQTFH